MADTSLTRFAWLADAPLFADSQQIERFYDAVVRPTYIEGATTLTVSETDEGTLTTKASGGGELSLGGGFLQYLFGAKAKVSVDGEVGGTDKSSSTDGRQVQWLPIRTPQRQLEQLLMAYERYTPQRVLHVTSGDCGILFDPTVWAGVPRAIVVLDLPGRKEAQAVGSPEAKFIPMAMEVEKGDVRLLYPELRKVQDQDQKSPPLQSPTPSATVKTSAEQQADLWMPLIDQFDSWDAMKVLEDGARGQTVRWIDFRIPIRPGTTEDARTIHLHLVAAGSYDLGVFGYNLIQRGHKHGVRIVATLKAGADLNVLAIYEK